MIATGKTTRTWVGQSGQDYSYRIRSIADPISWFGSNFIVGFTDAGGVWTPLYIGESSRLTILLKDSGLITWLRSLGGTHLHVRANSVKTERVAEKSDLILRYRPPLNDPLTNY